MSEKKITPSPLYDTIIVGGGIVGAGLFREQSLHQVKVLLLEQADFSSQTSQGSSKMLHGGIRYLENMDFALVFEALKEKNLWLKLAPNTTKEIPFYLPVYKESKWPLFFMRIGLFLYDLLSLFKNSPHQILSKKKTLAKMPGIKTQGLRGAGMYFDGIVDDSKLALECIYDGLTHANSKALNYKKVTSVNEKSQGIYQVDYTDTLSGEVSSVFTKFVLFATGPFTDQVLKGLDINWQPIILASKGTHLWLKEDSLPIKDAMVLQTKDKRIIFVIPQKNKILIGTTEMPLDKKDIILNISATKEEVDYLLSAINEYFPSAKVSEKNILSSFCAVRPLIRSHESSSKTSRHHKIYNPAPGMYVLVGGKYTTFRKMALELNNIIFRKLKINHQKSLSKSPLKASSTIQDPFKRKITKSDILHIVENEYVRTKEDLIHRRLSLPCLEHLNDPEIESFIKKLRL